MTRASANPATEQAARLEHWNDLVRGFGESLRAFFRERSVLLSPLFNLPGRLILGSYCYYEQLPVLIAEIVLRATPEEFGRGMKRLCARPNAIHLNSLLFGFLMGREQALLTGAARADDAGEIGSLLGFWERAMRAYRNDALLLPDEAGFSLPVLPTESVAALDARLRAGRPAAERRQYRRMMATLELFTFILNGESRVGVLHHGPYPAGEGDILVVKELIGLREDYYSWAHTEARPPLDRVARVMRLRGAEVRVNLFGSMTLQPKDYDACIVAEEYFAVEGDSLRPIAPDEAAEWTRLGADAQQQLYRKLLEWDDRYRIEYGAEFYAYLLRTFAEPLGNAAEFGERIRKRFRESAARHLDDLASGREQPLVLRHITTTSGPIFSPIRAG